MKMKESLSPKVRNDRMSANLFKTSNAKIFFQSSLQKIVDHMNGMDEIKNEAFERLVSVTEEERR
jgi:predicted  nucleic acid-binding Zn ribbon protein